MTWKTRQVAKKFLSVLEQWLQVWTVKEHTFWTTPLHSCSTVVDLGANRCDFSVAVLQRFKCKVYPVEPNPYLVPNDAGFNVPIRRVAIMPQDGEVEFCISENSEASSVYSEIANAFGCRSVVKVPCMSFSNFLQSESIEGNVSLLKMDIEGVELDLLSSLSGDELSRVDQITVEFHAALIPETAHLIESVIKGVAAKGFSVVNCSYPYFDNVLFVNGRLLQRSPVRKINLALLRFLYIARGSVQSWIGRSGFTETEKNEKIRKQFL